MTPALLRSAAWFRRRRAPATGMGRRLWGLSYHVDRSVDYNEDNWGLGLRYYLSSATSFRRGGRPARQQPRAGAAGLGGRRVPDRAAAGRLQAVAVAALTAAYYQYRNTEPHDFKIGPVPGVAVGCGHVKTNVMAVLRKSSEPLAALTASLTIMF